MTSGADAVLVPPVCDACSRFDECAVGTWAGLDLLYVLIVASMLPFSLLI